MRPEEISDLITRKSETANVEYKAGFEWKKENKEQQLELLRDMIAMANIQDGGAIILGIEDGTYDLIGVNQEILTSFDQSDVGQMLYSYSEPKLTFALQKDKLDDKDIVVIHVSEFTDVPIVCNNSMTGINPKKLILREGALYIRTEDAKTVEISSVHEMRQLISRAMLKRGDELLRLIENLIKGKPIGTTEGAATQYEQEVAETNKWFVQVMNKGFLAGARWEVIAYPTQYKDERIPQLSVLKQLIRESEVHLRGWSFPYVGNRQETGMFNSGFQSYIDWEEKREGFRLYKSGLFVWTRAVAEDLLQGRKGTLDFVVVIYSVTEMFAFLKRLYEPFPGVDQVHVSIRLTGCRGRELVSSELRQPMRPGQRSQDEEIVWEKDFQVVDLRASAEEIARQTVRHIFNVFNWTDVSEDFLMGWQDTLLHRVGRVRSS